MHAKFCPLGPKLKKHVYNVYKGLAFVSGLLLRLSSGYWFCLLVEYSLEDTS